MVREISIVKELYSIGTDEIIPLIGAQKSTATPGNPDTAVLYGPCGMPRGGLLDR